MRRGLCKDSAGRHGFPPMPGAGGSLSGLPDLRIQPRRAFRGPRAAEPAACSSRPGIRRAPALRRPISAVSALGSCCPRRAVRPRRTTLVPRVRIRGANPVYRASQLTRASLFQPPDLVFEGQIFPQIDHPAPGLDGLCHRGRAAQGPALMEHHPHRFRQLAKHFNQAGQEIQNVPC